MEKAIIRLLKGGSAVIYLLILVIVLAIPVIFVYQALMPPVFTLDTIAVEENFTGDEVIPENDGEWQKVQLSLVAKAGKFSPYSFYIESFGIKNDVLPAGAEDAEIVLDEPVFCTKDSSDPFTITLYIKGTEDVYEFIKSVSFNASDYTKSFGEFRLKFADGKARPFRK